jgi:hypothetical protein|tara:strand:+ start:21953 stop:22495 length:543 start_codon:yes stop_codon:yes gene_type:complete
MPYKIKTITKRGRVKAGAVSKLRKEKRRQSKIQMERLGNILYRRVLQDITKPAIPLGRLRALGHPYAKKHGSIQTSKLGGLKSYQIMTRTGKLAESLDFKVVSSKMGSQQTLYVFFKKDSPAYVKHVVKGTKFMLGRDVINEVLSKTNRQHTIKFMTQHLMNTGTVLNQKDIRKILRIGR